MNNLSMYIDEISKSKLLSIQLNLTNACPCKCKYCRKYEWPNASLDYDVLQTMLSELKQRGLQSVTLSGGEPLMYYKIIDLLEYLHQLGLSVNIISTFIINDFDILHTVAKYTNKISVSMDGADDETYAKTRGVNGLRVALKNISYVNTIRKTLQLSPIRFSTTISSLNADNIVKIFELGRDYGCRIKYFFMHDYNEYMVKGETYKLVIRNFEEVAKLDSTKISNVHLVLNSLVNNLVPEVTSINCTIPHIHAVIDANGDIYPCCKLMDDNGEYGSQKKYSYGNIYNGITDFEKRFDTTYNICSYCHGCWSRYMSKIDEINEIKNAKRKPLFL